MSIATREKDVEHYLVRALDAINLPCVKFVPEQKTGMPDRLVLLPGGRVLWVELKTAEGSLSEIQRYRHKELQRFGQYVVTVRTKDAVDNLIHWIKEDMLIGG